MNGEVENIKQGIIYSLEKRGVLENLRAYLRTDLYKKLKENDEVPVPLNSTTKFKFNETDYSQMKVNKLSISLIADYLKKNNLNYALSVYLPESKSLIGDELCSDSELSQLCQFSFEELEKSGEVSFLNFFIKKLVLNNPRNNPSEFKSSETQTEQQVQTSMEEKLKEIDNKYNKGLNLEALMPAKALEEKMLKFQRELEGRYKADLEREVLRVKEVEISQMRIEENRKYMKKLEEVREEYEKDHRDKLEALKKRESDVTIRISFKEKELETQLYENRQKFLAELELLKRKEDELKRKYDNDYNNLKLEEDKFKFKQKELDYIKDTSLKKINEEIEQFKLEYDRLFENEKNEIRKKKLDTEEKEFKNSLFEEKLTNVENENKALLKEKSVMKEEFYNLEKLVSSLKKDNEVLRDELKIMSVTDKRNADVLSKQDVEIQHLREENRLLRESVDDQKKLTEERRKDQGILIENMKKQLDENLERMEKNKSHYDSENERLKKFYLDYIEREKETHEEKISHLEKKIKLLEEQCKKYKDLYNQMSKRAVESNVNINTQSQGSFNPRSDYANTIKMNNYFNNLNDIKATDRLMNWSKLEKEADDIKMELKRSFAVSSRRDERINSPSLPISTQHIDKVYSDVYDKIYAEKLNQIKQAEFENLKITNVLPKFSAVNEIQPQTNLNAYKTITSVDNPDSKQLHKEEEKFGKSTQKVEENINSVRSDQNIMNTIHNVESKREVEPVVVLQTKLDEGKTEKSPELKTYQNTNPIVSKPVDDGRSKMEEELNKIKEDYNKKLQNEKTPTPVIISGTSVGNNSIRSNNKDFDRQDSNQDFSVGNITSSNEWDLESNRKDTNRFQNSKQITNNPTKSSDNHKPTIITSTAVKKEDKKEPTVINLGETKNPTVVQNISPINKSNPLTKDPNAYLTKSKGLNQSIKEELEESQNFSNIMENINKDTRKSFSESQVDYGKSSFNKFSNVNFEYDKGEIEEDIKVDESENYDYDFVEDVDGLDKKMSVDLDNFAKGSIGNNNSLRNATANNVSKSVHKTQSIDKNLEKFLQSRTSNIEENIIEDISIENSKKDKDLPNSAKSNTIEEDSNLKYNDYYQSNANLGVGASSSYNNIMKNVLKDSSLKDSQKLYESRTSDIKEEIIPDDVEDDGYVPVDHNEDYY